MSLGSVIGRFDHVVTLAGLVAAFPSACCVFLSARKQLMVRARLACSVVAALTCAVGVQVLA
mgnify:CR=1 FL=1